MENTNVPASMPESEAAIMRAPQHPMTVAAIEYHNKKHTTADRLEEIEKEFRDGFNFIKKYQKSVTIYGSARLKAGDEHYEMARSLAKRIVKDTGCAIVTGGSNGIMEAANKGAFEAGGDSIGLNIQLPHEQRTNPYLTDTMSFYYFFIRKVMLGFFAEAYIFFPGGFGTLDEFFEMATLVQTGKIPKVPVILVGNDFWKPLEQFIRTTLVEQHGTITAEDLGMLTITEDADQIISIIKNAPLRKG